MSSKETPQYEADKRRFLPLKNSNPLIKQLLSQQMGSQHYHLHEKYQGLLLKVLPPAWRHQVYFEKIEKGEWHLLVANSEAAFKLRFLHNEISQALNQYLSKPIRLRIHVQPNLWQIIPQTRRPIAVKSARAYTEAEAEQSIKRFLADAAKKH